MKISVSSILEFTSERKCMSVQIHDPLLKKHFIYAKGSPEHIK